MAIPLYHVDAFTSRPFAGNPAAVCLLDASREAGWMQAVAREMNLSETAFVAPRGSGFDLRWFTPQAEVDLCGHATLAAAHVLWESGRLPAAAPAAFHTKSGMLRVERSGAQMTMDFPAEVAVQHPAPPELDALGVTPLAVLRNRLDYLVEVAHADDILHLRPDLPRLKGIATRGIIVTARSGDPDCDFVSRFFAPAVGIDEDPVTGSAHCALGPYWGGRLGKARLIGRQLSPRGGDIGVTLHGERVVLCGEAVTVLRGELLV